MFPLNQQIYILGVFFKNIKLSKLWCKVDLLDNLYGERSNLIFETHSLNYFKSKRRQMRKSSSEPFTKRLPVK